MQEGGDFGCTLGEGVQRCAEELQEEADGGGEGLGGAAGVGEADWAVWPRGVVLGGCAEGGWVEE